MKQRKEKEFHKHTEQWVAVDQVAMHLSVKPDTVYKWLERDVMPAHKIGRLWRFKLTEVDEWVRSGEAKRRVVG